MLTAAGARSGITTFTKEAMARAMGTTGTPARARRRLPPGRLTILMFHGVEAEPLSPACWHVSDTATVTRQLAYVRRHFRVLPLETALQQMTEGTLPSRAMALTFDDGTQNLATQMAPILHRMGLPAAIFLTTGPMGTDELLWPDRLWLTLTRTRASEVDGTPLGLGTLSLHTASDRSMAYACLVARAKELANHERIARLESLMAALEPLPGTDRVGPFRLLSADEARAIAAGGLISLHPHTVTHPILARCTDEEVEREIAESCSAVENLTQSKPTIFAYPNGRQQDFDERARSVLRQHGIRWALSTDEGQADVFSDPFALPRVAIGSDLSFAHFKLLVSGALTKRRERAGGRTLVDT